MKTSTLSLSLLLASLTGCVGPIAGGTFEASGFQHNRLPLSIAYADANKRQLLDGEWQVDSHRNEYGKPTSYRQGKREVGLDLDGDDDIDKMVSAPRYDFDLVRRDKRGQILMFTEVLRGSNAEKRLSVLAGELIERATGLHFRVERTARGVEAEASNWSSHVQDELPIRVAGHDGYMVLVDIRSSPDDDPVRIALVLLPAAAPIKVRSNLGTHHVPAVHVLMLTSDIKSFDDGMRSLQQLLGRVKLAAR